MKIFAKILLLVCLFIGGVVKAEPYSVLVLPTDLYFENYYTFSEPSEIFANDIIFDLNKSGKFVCPNLYDVRSRLNSNPQLKTVTVSVLDKYKRNNKIDFGGLKKLSQSFNSNSVILISSQVVQNSKKRNMWEVMEVSSVFKTINRYELVTNVVLTDNVNDLVMWSGKYSRFLGDNELRFWAKSSSQATSQLEKIKMYSKDNLSKVVGQNIILRFFPKTPKSIVVKTQETKQTDFRPNTFEKKITPITEFPDLEPENIYSF